MLFLNVEGIGAKGLGLLYLPAASGSHWLNTPNTEEPVSNITLKA